MRAWARFLLSTTRRNCGWSLQMKDAPEWVRGTIIVSVFIISSISSTLELPHSAFANQLRPRCTAKLILRSLQTLGFRSMGVL